MAGKVVTPSCGLQAPHICPLLPIPAPATPLPAFWDRNSGSWWWTGKPGVRQSMGSQELDTTERLNWTDCLTYFYGPNPRFSKYLWKGGMPACIITSTNLKSKTKVFSSRFSLNGSNLLSGCKSETSNFSYKLNLDTETDCRNHI